MFKNKPVFPAMILVAASLVCTIALAGCGGGGGGASASPVTVSADPSVDDIGNGGTTVITANASGVTNPASAMISIDWTYSIDGASQTDHVVVNQPMSSAGSTGKYQYSYLCAAGKSTKSGYARLYDTYSVQVTVVDGTGKPYTGTTTFRVAGPLRPPDPLSKIKGSSL